jgi:ABC-2 type transport system ATP-binding protein
VRENIRLYGGIYGVPSRHLDARADACWSDWVPGGKACAREVPALGWKQKLASPVAVFHEPKVDLSGRTERSVDPAARRHYGN